MRRRFGEGRHLYFRLRGIERALGRSSEESLQSLEFWGKWFYTTRQKLCRQLDEICRNLFLSKYAASSGFPKEGIVYGWARNQ